MNFILAVLKAQLFFIRGFMKFYLNGDLTPSTTSLTISTLCKNLEINLDGTVILLNDDILQKDQYYFPIKENDKVEILRFVSGG